MLRPQLAQEATLTSLEAFINDDSVVFEQKLDGHRLLLCSPGGDFPPTALTRAGTPYTRKLPKALQEFRFPEGNGPMDFILDGELVDGIFWVFDMIARNVVTEAMPLRLRRYTLENSIDFWGRGNSNIRLVPQAKTREEKIALADKALASNFEGLIIKQTNAPYRSGMRTQEWLKVKFVTTADCIVLDVRDDGKESVRLGMVEPDNAANAPETTYKIIEVGRASLIGKEKNGEIKRGDVIEVKYLYAGAQGRLYQPTILRKRDDKGMHECDISQMKHVNKSVLETL